MTTATLRRFALALSTAAMLLLALTLTAARPQAQTSDHPPACGGRDQAPCTVLSVFWNENFGVCDRGLKVDFLANRCINSTRRQGKGTEFRNSWTGRALKIQQDQLGWNTPLGDVPLLMARHAYQNEADGYAGSAQLYSMTELLDAGVRALRIEVHASADETILTGTYPKMCFSMATAVGPLEDQRHSGCVITDRWFANALREIRDWMVEPGHERDVVTLVVDMRIAGNAIYEYPLFDLKDLIAPLDEYFRNDSRIGLLDWVESGLSIVGALPSRAWMVNQGKRVIVLSTGNRWDNNLMSNAATEWNGGFWRYPLGFGLNEFRQPYPDCRVKTVGDLRNDLRRNTTTTFTPIQLTEGRTWMLDGEDFAPTDVLQDDIRDHTASHYPTYRAPTAAELRNVMKCNVGFVGLNRILDPAIDPGRVRGMIWSWADDEPIGAGPGNGARVSGADGRWRVRSITESAAYACRAGDGSWKLGESQGVLTDGIAACAAAGATFQPPQNGRENELARAAIAAAGKSDAWVNFVALGGDQWTTATEPHIVVWDMAGLGGLYEEVNTLFALAWNVDASSVDWSFGDGTAVVTTVGSNTFPNFTQHTFTRYGTYEVTAVVHVGGSTTTIRRTFTVKQKSDLPMGPQIALDSPPANPTEGSVVRLGVSSWWPFAGIRCRPGGAVTPPPGDLIFSWIIDGRPRYVTEFSCPTTAADKPQLTVEVLAAFPDPSTGQPVLDPATGQFATMSKFFHFDVANVPPGSLSFTGPEIVRGGSTADFVVHADDAPGTTLTVTIEWPYGQPAETFTMAPGSRTVTHQFGIGSFPFQQVRITVSDGHATGSIIRNLLVEPRQVEIVSKEGPLMVEASPTAKRRFTMYTRNPDGGPYSLVQSSCGEGATVGGGPTWLGEQPDGTASYAILCIFPTPDIYEVSMRFANASTFKTETFVLFATAPADTTAPVITVTPPAPVEATGPVTPVTFSATATDNVDGSVALTCDKASGTGFPVGMTRVTCTAKDAANNPASAEFDVTVTDLTGPAVTVPSPIAVEATSGAGAAVTFAVSASDLVDGARPVTCDHASGATFPLGVTTVKCTATDAHNNTSAAATFTVTVGDSTAPVLSLPSPIAGEAATGAGLALTFTVSAVDAVDGARPVTCDYASGGTFPLGVTTVKCTATDAHNNTSAPASFTVTIVDTTAPVVSVPSTLTAEATNGAGAVVTFTASALDSVDAARPVSCDFPSGATFPLGTTTVKCSASDTRSNTGDGFFTVTVRDTTAPGFVGTTPNLAVDATGANGAVVIYAVPQAMDAVNGSVAAACSPVSGATFQVGTTTVACTATDAAGNSASRSFTVTVRGAVEQVATLQTIVAGVGPGKSLKGQADAAAKALAAGNTAGAIAALTDMINHLKAQSGKSIPAAQANALIAQTQQAIAALR